MTSSSAYYPVRRVPVYGRNMVATSQPLAAQAGLRALQTGGNAIDAALSAAITLTVVEPTGNGIGSDAFAIVWDGTRLHGLNASGRSPASWTPDRFSGLTAMAPRGWESVTVPGAVAAWSDLSARFGKFPFQRLFDAAIDYARHGFVLSPTIAALWANGAAILKDQPGFSENFMPGGAIPRAGEVVRNPALAATLEAIASSHGEAFYKGDLAARIAAAAKEHGAALDRDDLAAHTNDWCGTISAPFHGAEVHEIPPNGQGIAALMALGMLEQTEVAELDPDSARSIHLQIEAMKLAFADVRQYVSDLATMDLPHDALLDPAYLARRAAVIDRNAASLAAAGAPRGSGTVYLTVADENGMMVSYIQSNYAGFGSGVVVPGTGIHLQNRGAGFNLIPGHPNQVGPRKRPLHTIIPGFVTRDGLPQLSFGVMGGPMQPQGHVQMVLRNQVFGQDPQKASDAPRWRFVQGRAVAVETAMDDRVVVELAALGHEITREAPDAAYGFGGAQLIERLADGYVGGSDHRKDGMAVAF